MSLEKANAMLKKGAIAVIALFLVSNIYSIITYDNMINAVIESVSLTGEISTALRESGKSLIINVAAPLAGYLIVNVAFAVLCFRAAKDNKKIMPAFIFSIFLFIYEFRSVPNLLISSPYHPMMTKIFLLVGIALLGLMVYTTWTINKANKVLCKNCGKEVSAGAIFCANCGWSRIGIIPKKLYLKIISSLKKIIKPALAILVTVVIVLVIYNVPKPKGKVYELGDIKKVKLVTKYWKNSLVENFDTVKFGSYYQSDSTIKEPIEWIVLDRQSDKTLILSKYILDGKVYNSKENNVTWETCTLRNWLNNDFYHEAFSSSEQNRIQITNVINNGNSEYNVLAGNNTNDKIFCLSIDEAEKYFYKLDKIKANKMIATKGTYYVRNLEEKLWNGNIFTVYAGSIEDGWYFGNGHFWLRSSNGISAYSVRYDGHIRFTAVNSASEGVGVRPALWISY